MTPRTLRRADAGSIDPTPTGGAPRVVLVDPDRVLRAGLGLVLAEAGFETVGETSTGGEALLLVAALTPEIVLVSAELPDMAASAALRELSRLAPGTTLLALSARAEPESVASAIEAGASAFLRKDLPLDQLVTGVLAAFARDAIVTLGGHAGRRPTRAALSPRELEVLRLLARGHDNAGIAAQLFISRSTAKAHVSHILRKLDSRNRIQAAVYAAKCGLV